MSGPETSRAQSLVEWLEIATAQLSGPAKKRIGLEIEAHFAESVESHQAAGCSEAEARLAALSELGDPHAAAKRFRRRHLTEKEAKRVGQVLESSEGIALLLIRCMLYAIVYVDVALMMRRHHVSLVLVPLGFLMCVGVATIGFLVARRKCSTFDVQSIFLAHLSCGLCLLILALGLGIWDQWFLFLVFFGSGQFHHLVPDLRVWHKLRQLHTVWPKTPTLRCERILRTGA